MGSGDRTLVHLSSYIPSGVVSTSETSTVSEEICVPRGRKKKMQLATIYSHNDIQSNQIYFCSQMIRSVGH